LEDRVKIPKRTVGRGNKRLNPEILRSLLAKGKTAAEVGMMFGVTKQRIHQIVGATGYPPGRRPVKTNKVKALLPKIEKLVLKRVPISEIARKFKLSEAATSRTVMVHDIRPFQYEMHGTQQRYQRRACRCRLCCKANSDRCRDYRERRRKRESA